MVGTLRTAETEPALAAAHGTLTWDVFAMHAIDEVSAFFVEIEARPTVEKFFAGFRGSISDVGGGMSGRSSLIELLSIFIHCSCLVQTVARYKCEERK